MTDQHDGLTRVGTLTGLGQMLREPAGDPATCPVCRQDKTPYRMWPSGPVITPDCDCDRARAAAEAGKAKIEAEARRIEARIARSGLPPRYRRASFDNFVPQTERQRQVLRMMEEYANGFGFTTEDGLLVAGPKGTGKTHLVASVALDLCRRGFQPRFWNVPELLQTIRSSFNAEAADKQMTEAQIMQEIMGADLLILDDLGTEKPSDWVADRLYLIVNWRYEHLKPVLVTTNATMQELAQALAAKTVSRLAQMCQGLELKGPDYRLNRK